MKKFSLKKAISLVLALTCILCLVACGGGSDVAGTYRFKTMEMEGMSLDLDALMSVAGMDADSVKMELVLDKDGTFELNVDALGENASQEGTYKVSGSTLTLTAEGEDLKATLKDGVITIEEDGVKMTFEK